MDTDKRYCLGCKRTLGEIAGWGEMNDVERAEIMHALPTRRSDIAEVPAAPLA